MDIRSFVDLNLFQRIQDLFSDATGLAAIAVDNKGEYITKGSNFTDFCMKYTRGCQEGLHRCVKCDNECKGTYFCHAGLMDFSSDIVVNGERVGAIIGGQVLPQPPDLEKFRGIARELGIDEEAYLQALKKVPVRSEKMIRASAEMLGTIVNQLVNLGYFKSTSSNRVEVLNREVPATIQAVRGVKAKMGDLQQVASMEKILALNASVEAARAGQAGVGFAVVAREIGELSRNASSVYAQIIDYTETIEAAIHAIDKTQT